MGSGSHAHPARYARICAALSVDDDPPPSMPPGPASAGRVQEAVRHARQAVPNSRLERPELPPERAGRPEYLQRRSSLTARSSRSARRGGPRRCARREGPGGDGELGRVSREEGVDGRRRRWAEEIEAVDGGYFPSRQSRGRRRRKCVCVSGHVRNEMGRARSKARRLLTAKRKQAHTGKHSPSITLGQREHPLGQLLSAAPSIPDTPLTSRAARLDGGSRSASASDTTISMQ